MNWAGDSPLDAVQSLAMIVMCGVLIYAVHMIGSLVRGAVEDLRNPLLVVVRDNVEIRRQLVAAWKRIEALEDRAAAAEGKKPARPGPEAQK
ncbi:MAG: hypothetical protein WA728_32855 [Xanthobacteraceae bacterium]